MESIKGYDSSYLMDEQRYRALNGFNDNDVDPNEGYFTVDGEKITDYKGESIDAYSSVYEFDDFYFTLDDVDSFIQFLLEKNIYGVNQLFDCMTPQGKRDFLQKGFNQETNDFIEQFDFEEVERS
ncbi:hypothetical protein D1B17_07170 [Companilactobacillus zhachilii]|uniref:Uncharacterized protein n=1 Tax=Companilactobacillus zhachilii TaxID=2304606 RepID=A0A386PU77_9LACO|nr:hypothetical protein [Companilactobacillus zhachilii]AYE38429.1 hypothetical protein D1B17_07170 [Companilactobacillus zhachilii]